MRILSLTILTIGTLSAAGPTRAQTYDPGYPVCMHITSTEATYEECHYSTMPQCAASAAGRAAQCNINPYYVGATASPARRDQRHRRAHSSASVR
jgi:Protein of unknown function (DUF3551)